MNGYEVYVLGKNGEPKHGIDVNLCFHLLGNHQVNVMLTTDNQGRIILGALKNVTRLNTNVRV